MKNSDRFREKKCLVLGLAKSGYAAALLLHRFGAKVTVNDYQSLEDDSDAENLRTLGIEVIGGGHPEDLLDQPFDWVVKNPGIPYSNPVVKEALDKGIPVMTEPEIGAMISEAPFIAITGSNGKTTTTTLIGEMLKASARKPLVAGNIGTAVICEVSSEAQADEIIVAEMSSFQLLGTNTFRPHISVFLNLVDAHLDYHGTREEYANAKAKIFANQTEEDFAVVNADDQDVMRLVRNSAARKVLFSMQRDLEYGAYIKDGNVYFNDQSIIPVSDIALPGDYNLENILAATAASKLYGADNKAIASVLRTFRGVKHRLQFVDEFNERKFYNNSKATNLLATQKALSAFHDPIILLAGGLDRGNGFDELIPAFKGVKAIVTFGETAPKIIEAAKTAGMKRVEHVEDLEEAVPVAYSMSAPGDVILLSPACASWDQFRTFEERGDMFIDCVHRLR